MITIGARGSALSRRQAELVQAQLTQRYPDRRFECVAIASRADRQAEAPLASLAGGEGIFVKELEAALLAKTIDLAVHSMKDLPLEIPKGLAIGAVTLREDARDAFISRTGQAFDAVPSGARIGTSSPRRRSQVLHRRSDLVCEDIRGNVETRLRKLDEGRYDAIVVAAAGLIRLDLAPRITEYFPFEMMVPAPGQGALVIEIRKNDKDAQTLASSLHDRVSAACIEAERAFLAVLGGGCRVPIAAYAEAHGETLILRGRVIAIDGSRKLEDRIAGAVKDAKALGKTLGERILKSGARELLSLSA